MVNCASVAPWPGRATPTVRCPRNESASMPPGVPLAPVTITNVVVPRLPPACAFGPLTAKVSPPPTAAVRNTVRLECLFVMTASGPHRAVLPGAEKVDTWIHESCTPT